MLCVGLGRIYEAKLDLKHFPVKGFRLQLRKLQKTLTFIHYSFTGKSKKTHGTFMARIQVRHYMASTENNAKRIYISISERPLAVRAS